MKKAIVTLSVILLTAVSAFAGGDKNANRVLINKSSQGWFIDLSGTINAWQGSDRSSFIDFNTLYYKNANNLPNFGGSFKVGKFMTPVLGARLGVNMNQATNMYGDFVFENIHMDMLVNLCNWLGGYKPNRVYNAVFFGGFGFCGNGKDFFQLKGLNKEYFATIGLINNFRLSNSLDFHIDLNAEGPKWSIEAPNAVYDNRLVHLNLAAGLGLTWYLGGRNYDICGDCPEVTPCPEVNCDDKDREIKNLLARIAELESNDGTGTVEAAPCDTIVKFINGESAPFSIFFNKDSYQLRDNRDLINLAEIAKVAKDNDYKINLRGTCDSATASSEYNKKLAENRCRKVKDELVKLGIAEKNIDLNPVGGVSELKPAEYDRRVLITFTK